MFEKKDDMVVFVYWIEVQMVSGQVKWVLGQYPCQTSPRMMQLTMAQGGNFAAAGKVIGYSMRCSSDTRSFRIGR